MPGADQSCVCGAVPTGGNDQKQITQGHLRVSVLEEIRPSRMWPQFPGPAESPREWEPVWAQRAEQSLVGRTQAGGFQFGD